MYSFFSVLETFAHWLVPQTNHHLNEFDKNVLLSVCAVTLKVKAVSYVIDTAHLQHQLSTHEGAIAQKGSGSRNA